MISQHSMPLATRSRNRAGCPYLNQIGADAVLNWVSVLAGIDPATLPSELRAELGRLQLKSGAAGDIGAGLIINITTDHHALGIEMGKGKLSDP